MKIGVVIVCAGIGRRLGKTDKAVLKLGRYPLFYHTFKIFKHFKNIKKVVLVLRKDNFKLAKKLIKDKKVCFVEGGKERKDSVYNGLSALGEGIDYVLIHDGARPFVSEKVVRRIANELKNYPAVICGIKAADTVKKVNKGLVEQTVDRNDFFLIQTPQGFKKNLIIEAYKKIKNKDAFDDAQIVELWGEKVKVVEGDRFNIKITYPEDITLAEAIIRGWAIRE